MASFLRRIKITALWWRYSEKYWRGRWLTAFCWLPKCSTLILCRSFRGKEPETLVRASFFPLGGFWHGKIDLLLDPICLKTSWLPLNLHLVSLFSVELTHLRLASPSKTCNVRFFQQSSFFWGLSACQRPRALGRRLCGWLALFFLFNIIEWWSSIVTAQREQDKKDEAIKWLVSVLDR
jgi:hypothetical protein